MWLKEDVDLFGLAQLITRELDAVQQGVDGRQPEHLGFEVVQLLVRAATEHSGGRPDLAGRNVPGRSASTDPVARHSSGPSDRCHERLGPGPEEVAIERVRGK